MREDLEELVTRTIQMAYEKHCLNDDNIGWEELGDMLRDTLCELVGDEEFCQWLEQRKNTILRNDV